MKIENFKDTLLEQANKISVTLTELQLRQFEMYKNLLLEWNEKINLTAITEEYEIIIKHFVDCLEMVKYISKKSNVIDVGTGAGFPGIVIAIYYSDMPITLLDSLNKRVVFLEQVIKQLGLEHVTVVHARAEELAHFPQYRQKYDVAVARAVASLNTLLEYTSAYIKKSGICLFMKSEKLKQEIVDSKKAMKVLNMTVDEVYNYQLVIENEIYERNIIQLQKTGDTGIKYPRNSGNIKKQPL